MDGMDPRVIIALAMILAVAYGVTKVVHAAKEGIIKVEHGITHVVHPHKK